MKRTTSFSLKDVMEQLKRIESQNASVMNASDAARFLGMSKSSFDKITSPKNMLIPASKIGKTKRFLKSDLIKFVEQNKAEAIAV